MFQSIHCLVLQGSLFEYRLPNGKSVKYLDDGRTYLGNQLACELGGITMQHYLLILFGAILGIGHIYVTNKNRED